MSDTQNTDAKRAELADAFGQNLDPLAEYEPTFNQIDVDPFELFRAEVISTRDITDRTKNGYRILFDQWHKHMAEQERHPACPSEQHVKAFIQYLRDDRGNAASTIKEKIRKLNDAYHYWQDDPTFPHPQDYNPVHLAKSKMTLSEDQTKEPPRVTVDELRDVLSEVNHVRNRAIILIQLKLGLRATELCNIKLSEITIGNSAIRDHYDDLGTDPILKSRENVVHIPHDRDGNKSQRPRVLPLDDELRQSLLQYLLMRPDNGEPWLFLSMTTHKQPDKQLINGVWKNAFHPEYTETEEHRAITSHFGRHYFTTFWRVDQDLNSELVKYMRGDTPGGADLEDQRAMLQYIHTYYEDIREPYLKNIYKFQV